VLVLHLLLLVAEPCQVGGGLIAADGEDHKRQRKQISPGFTTVRIREYSEVFFTCSQKVRLCGSFLSNRNLKQMTDGYSSRIADGENWRTR
jgi:hypothetical protein